MTRACAAPQAELDQEHWCGVLQEVAIPGTGADPAAFLDQAVALANDRCDGTLTCRIFILPQVCERLAFHDTCMLCVTARRVFVCVLGH